jgi:hypothetical protein
MPALSLEGKAALCRRLAHQQGAADQAKLRRVDAKGKQRHDHVQIHDGGHSCYEAVGQQNSINYNKSSINRSMACKINLNVQATLVNQSSSSCSF